MEQKRQFATTQWSVVRQAGDSDSTVSNEALQELCQRYWYPLYSFARFKGVSGADAEDLTQSFLAELLKRKDFAKADPNLGRFRNYLLGALKNFLANDWKKRQAKKRGGGQNVFSMDFASADSRYQMIDNSGLSPDQKFEREWAMTLLDRVRKLLRGEFEKRGKVHVFESLQKFLDGNSGEATMASAAGELGMSEVAVKVAVHRMRGRFGHILRQEILATVDSEQEVEDEIQRLFAALAGK